MADRKWQKTAAGHFPAIWKPGFITKKLTIIHFVNKIRTFFYWFKTVCNAMASMCLGLFSTLVYFLSCLLKYLETFLVFGTGSFSRKYAQLFFKRKEKIGSDFEYSKRLHNNFNVHYYCPCAI